MVIDGDKENGFVMALNELQGGQTKTDLHHALMSLVGDVRSIGKKGTLTLTITVTPKANSQQLVLSDDIKIAAPKPDRDITVLFADDQNRLSRRDPRQPRLNGIEGDVRSFPRGATPDGVDRQTGEIR